MSLFGRSTACAQAFAARPAMFLALLLSALVLVAAEDPALKTGSREVLVKEVVFDSAVSDIVYLGNKHECILVTTKSRKLFYSQDSGQNWEDITNKIDPTGDKVELKAEKIMLNENDKTVAILQAKRRMRTSSYSDSGGSSKFYPYVYISEDSGKTWRKAWGKHHGIHSWTSHPKKREWALVSWWTGNCDKDSSNRPTPPPSDDEDEDVKRDTEPCVHRLMFTKDLGKTFVQVSSYVVQFSWGTQQSGANRIFFTAHRSKTGDQGRMSLWTSEVDLYSTDVKSTGRPSSPSMILKYGNKFLASGKYVLCAKLKSESAQLVNLMVSVDGGSSFTPALLPSGLGDMEEKWYTVLDTSEGAIILHVNSNEEGGVENTGRVFVSDVTGTRFTQSLANNVRSSKGDCEFDKILSLEGVYMANVVAKEEGSSMAAEKEQQAEQVETEAAAGTATEKRHGRGGAGIAGSFQRKGKEERKIRTVISFDKGGAWRYLKPPKVDSAGKPYPCEGKAIEECALHLHGTTSWDMFAPFYSSDNAVGIIMGVGNVGPSLRQEPEETNTYLSRDGGLTWMEAHRGAFIYEYGDHGGLIVMADDLKKTAEVVFSWNEGQSWYDFKVSKTPFEVDNIITEPSWTSTTFVMFGARDEGVGVLYYMKFDALGFPKCKGLWAADSVSSDYETWSPSDGVNSEQCMLGKQVSYTRRKKTSQCWNGEDYERNTNKKTCACTQEDFACDVGFIRKLESKECIFGGIEMLPERFVPTVCSGTFTLDAYRKVPGDVCEGGWQPTKATVPCPSSLNGINWQNIGAGLFIMGALYFVYTKMCTGPGAKHPLGDFAAPSGGGFSPMNALALCLGKMQAMVSGGRGFERFPDLTYKKLSGTEFDLDGIGANEFDPSWNTDQGV
eukprot:TRINITY_DN9174_c0_g1_i1.p1 TRINITY_DN9174_c0_g1~~TRINITY_DN9174_c0_g1_i1.p1  ORF type:complete len:895 (-),score=247.61 TRINITY_DN9174_c0_g1_i1:79-2763(-)